ncbi:MULTISPECIES: STAS domain-containing protein [Streptomyces]|uniref:STAS domain-containing protein n=1 Tax=Streptomyces gilvifuscus TaxID=1550617 RepID=A0ABT5FPR3_9ACTN|nr:MULTISPECIES: STAS domain-containing protein [Streptomyces]MBK3641731.1 STAS domain-containing protein [Streptomyces sp. MBT33]MDC2954517.1 STAS domain-containing protein [Streptomyces gilvifuscus]
MGTRISLSPGGRTATLTVDSDIDDRARPAIESAAAGLPLSVRYLTLDLTRVDFVDSALLHLVRTVDRSVTGRGGLLRIAGLRPQPSRLLALAADLWPDVRWEAYGACSGLN